MWAFNFNNFLVSNPVESQRSLGQKGSLEVI